MPKGMKTGARLNYRIDELLLTTNQKEVAKLLLNGLSFGEIASRLLTSKKSVRGTVEALINKFQCQDQKDLRPKLLQFFKVEKLRVGIPEVQGIPFLTDEKQDPELFGGPHEIATSPVGIPVADMTNPRFDVSGRVRSGRR